MRSGKSHQPVRPLHRRWRGATGGEVATVSELNRARSHRQVDLGHAGTGSEDGPATVVPLRPIVPGRHHGPPLVLDAVEAYLGVAHGRSGATDRARDARRLRAVADVLGLYRALVDVEDRDLTTALSALCGNEAPAVWNQWRAVVVDWLEWCLAANFPVPSIPTTCGRREHV